MPRQLLTRDARAIWNNGKVPLALRTVTIPPGSYSVMRNVTHGSVAFTNASGGASGTDVSSTAAVSLTSVAKCLPAHNGYTAGGASPVATNAVGSLVLTSPTVVTMTRLNGNDGSSNPQVGTGYFSVAEFF